MWNVLCQNLTFMVHVLIKHHLEWFYALCAHLFISVHVFVLHSLYFHILCDLNDTDRPVHNFQINFHKRDVECKALLSNINNN